MGLRFFGATHEQRGRETHRLGRDVIESRARFKLPRCEHRIHQTEHIPPRTSGGRERLATRALFCSAC
jgi:hypothetical protein